MQPEGGSDRDSTFVTFDHARSENLKHIYKQTQIYTGKRISNLNGGLENLKDNGVHLSPDEDQNAIPKKCCSSPKHTIGKKLEVSPSVSTPCVRKCAQMIV